MILGGILKVIFWGKKNSEKDVTSGNENNIQGYHGGRKDY